MRTLIVTGLIASLICFIPPSVSAQGRPVSPKADEVTELRLDESVKQKAAAMEWQIAAITANFALLQRQAQDLQAEMTRLLEEREKIIKDAARKVNLDVKDMTEWAFEKATLRYVRVKRDSLPQPGR